MELIHRLIVIDSVFSQPKGRPFDCIRIMDHIRDNEVNHQTLPHGEIAIYLDHLCGQGVIQIADQSGEYTRYLTAETIVETVVSNLTAVFHSPTQNPNLTTL
jgi:hypothetical protein